MRRFVALFAPGVLLTCEGQFPRPCSACHRTSPSFLAHIDEHVAVGGPHFDDCDDEDGAVGVLCFANCVCGSTLAVRYEDTREHRRFNEAVRAVASEGHTIDDVLQALVAEVHDRARSAAPMSTGAVSTATTDPLTLEAGAIMMRLVANGDVRIPLYPAVAMRVRAAAHGEDASLETLVALISADAALAAEIVRIANTAHFSRGSTSTSLPSAVSRLGTKQVARTALNVAAGSLGTGPGPLAEVRTWLWRRGVITATIAHDLAVERGLDADDAFLAGLLDILGPTAGALSLERVLSQSLPFPAQPLRWWLRLFDVFRRQLGRLVIEAWGLPAALQETIIPPVDGVLDPKAAVVGDAIALTRLIDAGAPIGADGLAATPGLATSTLITRLDDLATRCAAALAALQTSTTSSLATSSHVSAPPDPAEPCADVEVTVDDGVKPLVLRASAWDGEQLLVQGAQIAPGGLVKVHFDGPDGPLRAWATVRCATGDNAAAVLMPFALSQERHRDIDATLRR